MPRLTHYALPLLGCLAAAFAAVPAHAQYLYVGFNNPDNSANNDFSTPGFAFITSTGTTTSGNWAFYSYGSTPVSSTFDYTEVQAYNTSRVTISGGTFQRLQAIDSSVINLIGTNFMESSTFHVVDGLPYYTITGLLQGSATPFTADFTSAGGRGSTLEFNGSAAVPGANPVPEASTLISMGLLLLGGGTWMAMKRRKSALAA